MKETPIQKWARITRNFNIQAKAHNYLTGALFVMYWLGSYLDFSIISGAGLSLAATLILFYIWEK